MPHAKKNQITGYDCQDQSDGKEVWVGFGHLFAPCINKIRGYGNKTTDQGGKKICIGDIPFDHDCTPLTKISERRKNTPAMNSARENCARKSKTACWRKIIGEIIPAENQATATLPKTFEALFNWPMENLILVDSLSCVEIRCQLPVSGNAELFLKIGPCYTLLYHAPN